MWASSTSSSQISATLGGMATSAEQAEQQRRAIDPRVDIGHVHLKVADIDRALEFWSGALGFEVTQRFDSAAFVSAGGYHHHIGLNTWESRGGSPPPPRH